MPDAEGSRPVRRRRAAGGLRPRTAGRSGRARAGGYYLVGLEAPHRQLLTGIEGSGRRGIGHGRSASRRAPAGVGDCGRPRGPGAEHSPGAARTRAWTRDVARLGMTVYYSRHHHRPAAPRVARRGSRMRLLVAAIARARRRRLARNVPASPCLPGAAAPRSEGGAQPVGAWAPRSKATKK